MLISAPGISRPHGFTLLEVLVVMLIMGIFVGLVSAIVRPDDRGILRVESDRLAQLLELAATESRLTGKSIAWTVDGRHYRFWQLSDAADWIEIEGEDSLRARALPQGMMITGLQVENMPVNQPMRLEFGPYAPSLGFAIQMSLGAAHDSVTGSPVGEVRVSMQAGDASD